MRANGAPERFPPSRLAAEFHLRPAQARRWNRASVAMAVALLVIPLLLSAMALWTDWDLALADAQFDARLGAFPLRHAWLTERFNHVILKRVLSALAAAVVAIAVWDTLAPRAWSRARRIQWRIVAMSAVLVPLAISGLKQLSFSHCPWDLERYGGAEPYVRLFDAVPAGIGPGHCMPAGHASGALWLIALAVFFVPHRLELAALVAGAMLALGIGVGWLQQLRGAHFLSHTLWSAWLALLIIFLITQGMDRRPARA